jgi:hypothetical protein
MHLSNHYLKVLYKYPCPQPYLFPVEATKTGAFDSNLGLASDDLLNLLRIKIVSLPHRFPLDTNRFCHGPRTINHDDDSGNLVSTAVKRKRLRRLSEWSG